MYQVSNPKKTLSSPPQPFYFYELSGFTSLCEKYENTKLLKQAKLCDTVEFGINDLTKTLNNYLGQVLEILLNADADIYKFAGDALLCHWPINETTNENYAKKLQLVINSAINIQKYVGTHRTSVGVILRIKLAIAHGSYMFHAIGTNLYKNIICVGPAIREVNRVEKFCNAGDVTVSGKSWQILNHSNYVYKQISNMDHIKILEFLDKTKGQISCRMNLPVLKVAEINGTLMIANYAKDLNSKRYNLIKNIVSEYLDLRKKFNFLKNYEKLEEINDLSNIDSSNNYSIKVRRFFTRTFSKHENELLNTFVIKSILRKIHDNQPLQFMSELRSVTILFVNLDLVFDSDEKIVDKKLSYRDVKVYQNLFILIHNNVKIFGGVLTKTIAFDKGSSFLCVFGLPGIKHENESCHALECAHKLFELLRKIEFVKTVSMGITTGISFTGVIGHPFRCEYTVIGSKVNLAARLMAYYPGIITCDNSTYYSSRLPKQYFIELQFKEMKGVSDVGVVRQYKETNCDEIIDIESFEYPIVGKFYGLCDVFAS